MGRSEADAFERLSLSHNLLEISKDWDNNWENDEDNDDGDEGYDSFPAVRSRTHSGSSGDQSIASLSSGLDR